MVEHQAKILKDEGEKLEQAKAAVEQALTKEKETSVRLEEEKTKLTAAVNENKRLGALALKVTTDAEADAAAARAFAHDGPVVIEVLSSAEAISPHTTVTKLRALKAS